MAHAWLQAAQPFVRALHGWSVEELRCYVTWAKAGNKNLQMTSEAEQVPVRHLCQLIAENDGQVFAPILNLTVLC